MRGAKDVQQLGATEASPGPRRRLRAPLQGRARRDLSAPCRPPPSSPPSPLLPTAAALLCPSLTGRGTELKHNFTLLVVSIKRTASFLLSRIVNELKFYIFISLKTIFGCSQS